MDLKVQQFGVKIGKIQLKLMQLQKVVLQKAQILMIVFENAYFQKYFYKIVNKYERII